MLPDPQSHRIDDEPHLPLLTAEQRDELQRRLEEAVRNPDDVISWNEARNAALKRFGATTTN